MNYVVTGADDKFSSVIQFWSDLVTDCGLKPVVYDLGGLGSGKPVEQNLKFIKGFENFRKEGHYQLLANGTWKSRGVHKPHIVQMAFEELQEPFLYLDADAFLRGVPTKMEGDWDIAVTVRPPKERDVTREEKRSFIGKINAGVMWFNNTGPARLFIQAWKQLSNEEKNDQRALNLMLSNIEVGQVTEIEVRANPFAFGGEPEMIKVRVMGVPTTVYNNYYTTGVESSSVVHLKNNEWKNYSLKADFDGLRRRLALPPKNAYYEGESYCYDDSGIDLLDWHTMWLMYDLTFNSNDDVPVGYSFDPVAEVADGFVDAARDFSNAVSEVADGFVDAANDLVNPSPVDPSGS